MEELELELEVTETQEELPTIPAEEVAVEEEIIAPKKTRKAPEVVEVPEVAEVVAETPAIPAPAVANPARVVSINGLPVSIK